MALNDREQQILEQIEAQFHAEDPGLAEVVSGSTFSAIERTRIRLASAGAVLGLFIMLGFFTRIVLIAGLGFLMMVGCVGWIVMHLKRGAMRRSQPDSFDIWISRAWHRWGRRD